MIATATLRSRIEEMVEKRAFAALLDYVQSLRTTDHRTASTILSEARTWRWLNEEEWWEVFVLMVASSARAYLGTLLKAATARGRREEWHFESAVWSDFCRNRATDIDRRKMLEALLPLATTPATMERLVQGLRLEEESETQQALYYLKAATPVAYHRLFLTLRRMEDNVPLIRRFAVELIRKDEKTAFNLAAILAAYFDLGKLPGTFSLALPPHQLSRLESDYTAFSSILLQ
ncbi:MAG: hypothetical protein Q4D66_05150 [Bacteroidales bacterium]|nr:hypothetical protein [Bacteroidales bacterium]